MKLDTKLQTKSEIATDLWRASLYTLGISRLYRTEARAIEWCQSHFPALDKGRLVLGGATAASVGVTGNGKTIWRVERASVYV